MRGICPCLTRSRPYGHYLSDRRRMLRLREMAALQGFGESFCFNRCSRSQAGAMLGNAICVDVLVHLLPRVIDAAQLLEKPAFRRRL